MHFNKNNFKIGFQYTIHTFKNYFVIIFSIFSNKRYLNRPIGEDCELLNLLYFYNKS